MDSLRAELEAHVVWDIYRHAVSLAWLEAIDHAQLQPLVDAASLLTTEGAMQNQWVILFVRTFGRARTSSNYLFFTEFGRRSQVASELVEIDYRRLLIPMLPLLLLQVGLWQRSELH